MSDSNIRRCYICNTPLEGDNLTEEHIVLHAIGGKLKSYDLICRKCNSRLGDGPDQALAKDLEFFTTMLGVKRERQAARPIILNDEDGHEIRVDGPGCTPILHRPYINQTKDGDSIQIHIVARNMEELDKILKGKVRKGELTYEQAQQVIDKANSQINEHRPTLSRSICINKTAFPSIVKSAVNFYVFKTNDVITIKPLIPYIEREKDCKDVLSLLVIEELPYEENISEVTHMLHLEGSKESGFLYCLVEYFGLYQYLVVLSDNYDGPTINETYCYDVISGSEVTRTFSFSINSEWIEKYKKSLSERVPFEQFRRRADRILCQWSKLDKKKHLENLLLSEFEKFKDEPVFTENMVNSISRSIADFFASLTPPSQNT